VRRAAALALALACGAPPRAPDPGPQAVATARLPRSDELACFPCHSHLNWQKGPPFPHALAAHRAAGHCHVCHQGMHHEGRAIDRAACLSCHDQGSQELQAFARVERKSK
jgi:hypothetical protein